MFIKENCNLTSNWEIQGPKILNFWIYKKAVSLVYMNL